jgi:Mu transposase, C-terminal domain
VGRKLTVKADSSSVTIYDKLHEIVRYARCWQRGQTFGAERFQKELLAQRAAADRSAAQQRLVVMLGRTAEEYLRAAALQKAHAARAFGADYIANILRQQQSRREVQPPLRLKDPELNQLATDPLSLAEYDAFILRSRKESRDATSLETEPTQPDDDEPPTGSDDL